MRISLVQFTAGNNPKANLNHLRDLVQQAAHSGAEFVLTPEVSNIVCDSRRHQHDVLHHEEDDPFLAQCQMDAKALNIWLLIGSLALKTHNADERFANRSFLISPQGEIVARYDKIHMFDVQISETETYRESAAYRPGAKAIIAQTPFATIGLSICYDIRFPHLYRRLAQAGAQILTAPAAFSPVTGKAHWQSLLRARAIENGAFVLAPAQCGQNTPKRATYGHSLVISPWGEVLADGGTDTGITTVDLDLQDVRRSRERIPSFNNEIAFEGP